MNRLRRYGFCIGAVCIALGVVGAQPEPQVYLTGITKMFGRKSALLTVSGLGSSAESRSYVLKEGERDGEIEVLEIKDQDGTVKLRIGGSERIVSFRKNAMETKAQPPPAPGPAPMPSPAPLPLPSVPRYQQPTEPMIAIARPQNALPMPGMPMRSFAPTPAPAPMPTRSPTFQQINTPGLPAAPAHALMPVPEMSYPQQPAFSGPVAIQPDPVLHKEFIPMPTPVPLPASPIRQQVPVQMGPVQSSGAGMGSAVRR